MHAVLPCYVTCTTSTTTVVVLELSFVAMTLKEYRIQLLDTDTLRMGVAHCIHYIPTNDFFTTLISILSIY